MSRTTAATSPPPSRDKTPPELAARIARVRAFNRFYTRQVGALDEHLLRSSYSLAEVRVLYEIAHREAPTAGELGRELGLDAGYLSRVLRRLAARSLIEQRASTRDR